MISGRIAVWAGLCVVLPGCKKQETAAPTGPEPAAQAEPEAEAPEAEEEESPYLDAMNFNKTVEGHVGEVVACWRETAGKPADGARGRVKTTVLVDGDGRVKSVAFDPQRSTLKDEALFACMDGKIKAWRFNISLTGADSPMPYTFDLTADGLLKGG